MENIKKFTIFGERNSGTKYLKDQLSNILHQEYTKEYGFKHWYIKDVEPRGEANTTTDNECLKSIHDSDDTLFVVIVRDINDWVGAMHRRSYSCGSEMDKTSIHTFVTGKYISYERRCPRDHGKQSESPWLPNKNHKYPYFMDEADNLIELRNMKNNHFNNLKNKVKYYYLIRQEHLLEDITEMIKKYNLKYKSLKLTRYRKPTKYVLDSETIDFIKENLNNDIDNIYYS